MNQSVTLAQVPLGTIATVFALQGDPQHAQRLREMGLLPGTQVKPIRWAPLGDPLEIEVRGYKLSLRKQEAEAIAVTLT